MQNRFKFIIGLFLAVIMLCVQGSPLLATNAVKTYKISEIEGKYKTQGRTVIADDSLVMEWSASGIEFNAECEGNVSITVNTMRLSKTGESGGAYFSVLVDGVMQYADKRIPEDNTEINWKSNSTEYPFYINKTGESTFVIAQNLAFGKHKFEIYNQTEAKFASYGIKSITLNGEIIAAPENKNFYIEFVGDSITAGLGNVVKKSPNSPAEIPLYQDATRAWPYLTAKKMNADWSVVAVSGIPACDGIGYYSGTSMQTVYPRTRINGTAEWKSTREPDIVVLGLGTNDIFTYKNKEKDKDYLINGFEKMLELIRTKNPNTKIVWIYGMMTSAANEIIEEAVKNKGGAENGIYTLALPQNTSGGNGHPELAVQETFANTVSDCISRILSDTNTTGTTFKFSEINTSNDKSINGNNSEKSKITSDFNDDEHGLSVLKFEPFGNENRVTIFIPDFKLANGKIYKYSLRYRIAQCNTESNRKNTLLGIWQKNGTSYSDMNGFTPYSIKNTGWRIFASNDEDYKNVSGYFTADTSNGEYLCVQVCANDTIYLESLTVNEYSNNEVINFGDELDILGTSVGSGNKPEIVSDDKALNGKALYLPNSTNGTTVALPYQLTAGKNYTVYVRYRAGNDYSGYFGLQVTDDFSASNQKGKENSISKSTAYTVKSFTLNYDSTYIYEGHTQLAVRFKTWNTNTDNCLYIDSISIVPEDKQYPYEGTVDFSNISDVSGSKVDIVRDGEATVLSMPADHNGYNVRLPIKLLPGAEYSYTVKYRIYGDATQGVLKGTLLSLTQMNENSEPAQNGSSILSLATAIGWATSETDGYVTKTGTFKTDYRSYPYFALRFKSNRNIYVDSITVTSKDVNNVVYDYTGYDIESKEGYVTISGEKTVEGVKAFYTSQNAETVEVTVADGRSNIATGDKIKINNTYEMTAAVKHDVNSDGLVNICDLVYLSETGEITDGAVKRAAGLTTSSVTPESVAAVRKNLLKK